MKKKQEAIKKLKDDISAKNWKTEIQRTRMIEEDRNWKCRLNCRKKHGIIILLVYEIILILRNESMVSLC